MRNQFNKYHIDVKHRHNLHTSLLSHGVSKEYNITGITPQNFIDKHSGLDFDINSLRSEFKKHCDDYMTDLALDRKSKAVEFCSKIIYEIEPESRKVKKGTGDKIWKFIFNKKVQNADEKHKVFVATYKQENAQYTPENREKSMILTLKQSGLIALETFSRLVKLGYNKNMKLMTPLAGACFAKDDLTEMAKDLKMIESDLLIAINQSTQGSGQYLAFSDIDIAVCASIATTRNVKEENLKKGIVVKVLKQYVNKGKTPNKDRMMIIYKYATGGVPTEFAYKELVRMFDSEQIRSSAARQAAAIRQSEVRTEVIVPGSSPTE